jgi:N-acetylglucosamine kinase-like BadF-type ATPase
MNILVADSGSTKTEWCCFSTENPYNTLKTFFTKGLNPYYHNDVSIAAVLSEVGGEFATLKPQQIYFYGAGCSLPEKKAFISSAINRVFPFCSIDVFDDLLGAARALCGQKPGIAAILGTGSNSCYFDGSVIAQNVPSLGYILGDEGSGVFIGKAILRAFFYNELPITIKEFLEKEFDMTRKSVLDHIYRGQLPNRYIAQFARITHNFSNESYIKDLVQSSFRQFIQSHILKYQHVQHLPVGFVGSIANEHQEIMRKVLEEYDLQAGLILKTPMSKLLEFHSNVHEKSN